MARGALSGGCAVCGLERRVEPLCMWCQAGFEASDEWVELGANSVWIWIGRMWRDEQKAKRKQRQKAG